MGNDNIVNKYCGCNCKDSDINDETNKKDNKVSIQIIIDILQNTKNEMIINSVLSSTKDNSIQNNHKKKLFLNSKIKTIEKSHENRNNINCNHNNHYYHEDIINQTPKKQRLKLAENITYEGYIKENKFEGYGEYHSPEYNYIGNYTSGKKNGKGILEDLSTNSIYSGDFKDNMKDGFGEEKYKDGSIYIGQFRQNMKNGKGKLLLGGVNGFPGGKEGGGVRRGYEGEFKNDKICGKGKFIWNEKKKYIGEWDNNEISGYGIIIEEKLKHIGYFEHDLKEGFGCTFYTEQNFALLGKWENDFIEGNTVLININNNINSNINIDINNEIVVKMKNGEIIKMNLDEDELYQFKNSNDYKEMIKLFDEKFYPDYIKFIHGRKV